MKCLIYHIHDISTLKNIILVINRTSMICRFSVSSGANMEMDDHLLVLRDQAKPFVERLWAAVKLDFEIWDDPNKSPPNLSRAEFLRLVNFIPRTAVPRWERRGSSNGKHGLKGEDQVFNVNFEIVRGRFKHFYYLKGFFYDQDDLKGVEIQSFRIEKTVSRMKLRII